MRRIHYSFLHHNKIKKRAIISEKLQKGFWLVAVRYISLPKNHAGFVGRV